MEEMEMLARAKMYMEKLANGINPITNEEVAENDAVNNVRLSRCFFYVADVLRKVIENGGTEKKRRIPKQPFAISDEQLTNYKYFDEAVALSQVIGRINDLIDTEKTAKLSFQVVSAWLMKMGLLEEANGRYANAKTCPTESGYQLGISIERRIANRGEYYVNTYNRNAQEFIINHLQAIISVEENRR